MKIIACYIKCFLVLDEGCCFSFRAAYHNLATLSWLLRQYKWTAQLHHTYSWAQNRILDLGPTVSSISLRSAASWYSNIKLGKNVSEEYKWSLWVASWRNHLWHKFSPRWTRFLFYIVLFLFYTHWLFSALYIDKYCVVSLCNITQTWIW